MDGVRTFGNGLRTSGMDLMLGNSAISVMFSFAKGTVRPEIVDGDWR